MRAVTEARADKATDLSACVCAYSPRSSRLSCLEIPGKSGQIVDVTMPRADLNWPARS